MKASAVALLLAANAAFAQSFGWLPVLDLPPTLHEAAGELGPPSIGGFCVWDSDGPGPRLPAVVVAGALALNIPNGRAVAMQEDDGWTGISGSFNGATYTVGTYAAPAGEFANLYAGTGGGLYRYSPSGWTSVSTRVVHCIYVADLDGSGPQPPKLIAGGPLGVFTYDGTTTTILTGGTSVSNSNSLILWDRDGDGPVPARLLSVSSLGLVEWNGTQWSVIATYGGGINSQILSLSNFDFDGDGPDPAQLVASGSFTQIGGVTTGPVATLRNGAWSAVGTATTGGAFNRCISFDPDGSGPLPPWLVTAGIFSQVGGVAASNIAYFTQGSWHAFPAYLAGQLQAMAVNDQAQYSNSPQLLVGSLGGRPSFGVLALSDVGPSVVQQPHDVSGALGSTVQLTAVAGGDELVFHWYKGTQALVPGTTASGSVIHGAYTPTLTISGLTQEDRGAYHLHISNAVGSIDTDSAMVSTGCAADFNGDDMLDFFDYVDFVSAFSALDPAANFNHDAVIDFFDYLDFVQAFSAGC